MRLITLFGLIWQNNEGVAISFHSDWMHFHTELTYSGFENDVSVLLLVPIYYGCLAQMEFSDAEKKNVCRVTQKSPAHY